jgi:WD40 repeat protein
VMLRGLHLYGGGSYQSTGPGRREEDDDLCCQHLTLVLKSLLNMPHPLYMFSTDPSQKGSVPVVTLKAHDSKIYGIDWDRRERSKIVTCSLDKTIKYWTIPTLATPPTNDETYQPTTTPYSTSTLTTHYPIWRARNLPFGHGILSLPQRSEHALELFGTSGSPVQRFEGHEDVVKEFVWRTRGGGDEGFDDREFQLVSWSKDRTLKIWPVGREITEKVGFRFGEKIKVLQSRRGAKNISYTKVPYNQSSGSGYGEIVLVPQAQVIQPTINPSGISKLKPGKVDVGMTRGGGRTKAMDQLDWLTKVVKNPRLGGSTVTASPDSSVLPSRKGSVSRAGSLDRALSVGMGKGDWISLKDEIVKVNKIFPRPRVNFEKASFISP